MPDASASGLAVALELAFAVAMVASAVSDLAWRRLPNWLNAAIAIGYVPWAWAHGMPWAAMAVAAGVGAIVLLAGFVLFSAGVIGGGDAKMAAAVAVWIGFSYDLLRFFLVMSLAGGVLALAALAIQGLRGTPLRRPLPYGVAIAAAALDYWLHHAEVACRAGLC